MVSRPLPTLDAGVEWLVDAYGCAPERLREPRHIEAVFRRAVGELGLHPVAPPHFHVFPGEGGVTGVLMLSESHLTCHSFPEHGSVAINLFCCRVREGWPWADRLAEHLGATHVAVQRVERVFGGGGGEEADRR